MGMNKRKTSKGGENQKGKSTQKAPHITMFKFKRVIASLVHICRHPKLFVAD